MHDKYCYEKLQMALHDDNVLRTMAGGIAGLSVVADSLSAIRYAKVKPVRDETGLAVDFITEGISRNSAITTRAWTASPAMWSNALWGNWKSAGPIGGAKPTLSILTITSNVVYGKRQVPHRMAAKRASHLPRAPTPCMGGTATAVSLP